MRTIDVLRLAALSGLLTDPAAQAFPVPASAPAEGEGSFAEVLASLPEGPGPEETAVPVARNATPGAQARLPEPAPAEGADAPVAAEGLPAAEAAPEVAEVTPEAPSAGAAPELPAAAEEEAPAGAPSPGPVIATEKENGANATLADGEHRFEAPPHYETTPAPELEAVPASTTATPDLRIAAPLLPATRLESIVRQVQAAFRPEGTTVRLVLEPPELGAVWVEVRLAGSTLTARLEAERADTAAALAEGLPLLRHSLAVDGVRVDRFEIIAREAPASAPSPTCGDGAAEQGRERERAPPPPPHPMSLLRPNPPPPRAEARPVGAVLLDAWA